MIVVNGEEYDDGVDDDYPNDDDSGTGSYYCEGPDDSPLEALRRWARSADFTRWQRVRMFACLALHAVVVWPARIFEGIRQWSIDRGADVAFPPRRPLWSPPNQADDDGIPF